jgi:hypothetical protein
VVRGAVQPTGLASRHSLEESAMKHHRKLLLRSVVIWRIRVKIIR